MRTWPQRGILENQPAQPRVKLTCPAAAGHAPTPTGPGTNPEPLPAPAWALRSRPTTRPNETAPAASRSPLKGLRRWLRPDPTQFQTGPPARNRARPGSYSDQTSTGRRRLAKDPRATTPGPPPALLEAPKTEARPARETRLRALSPNGSVARRRSISADSVPRRSRLSSPIVWK